MGKGFHTRPGSRAFLSWLNESGFYRERLAGDGKCLKKDICTVWEIRAGATMSQTQLSREPSLNGYFQLKA